MTAPANSGSGAAFSRDLLRQVGEALYGPRWQSELARDLDISDRTVRRWAAGEADPRHGVWTDLRRLIADRREMLGALAYRLDGI